MHVAVFQDTLPLLHGGGCPRGCVTDQSFIDQRTRLVRGLRGDLELYGDAICPQPFRPG